MSKREYLKVKKNNLSVIRGGKFYEGVEAGQKEISLERLRELYNEQEDCNYTDEQLIEIRRFLNKMADIAISYYQRLQQEKNNQHNYENTDEKKSDTVCEGKYRRAG